MSKAGSSGMITLFRSSSHGARLFAASLPLKQQRLPIPKNNRLAKIGASLPVLAISSTTPVAKPSSVDSDVDSKVDSDLELSEAVLLKRYSSDNTNLRTVRLGSTLNEELGRSQSARNPGVLDSVQTVAMPRLHL